MVDKLQKNDLLEQRDLYAWRATREAQRLAHVWTSLDGPATWAELVAHANHQNVAQPNSGPLRYGADQSFLSYRSRLGGTDDSPSPSP